MQRRIFLITGAVIVLVLVGMIGTGVDGAVSPQPAFVSSSGLVVAGTGTGIEGPAPQEPDFWNWLRRFLCWVGRKFVELVKPRVGDYACRNLGLCGSV